MKSFKQFIQEGKKDKKLKVKARAVKADVGVRG